MTNTNKALEALVSSKSQMIKEIAMAGPVRAQNFAALLVNINNAIKVLQEEEDNSVVKLEAQAPARKVGRPAAIKE
jgi:hypothetical protein